MTECIPRSLCSWDFTVRGLSSGSATLEYDWIREQGRIYGSGMDFEVRKYGMIDARWTLEKAGSVVAEATKPSALIRSFEVTRKNTFLVARAASPFTRVFELEADGMKVGHISPMHPWTRRAKMQCPDTLSEPMQLFTFWLVALLWRRSANSSSGST